MEEVGLAGFEKEKVAVGGIGVGGLAQADDAAANVRPVSKEQSTSSKSSGFYPKEDEGALAEVDQNEEGTMGLGEASVVEEEDIEGDDGEKKEQDEEEDKNYDEDEFEDCKSEASSVPNLDITKLLSAKSILDKESDDEGDYRKEFLVEEKKDADPEKSRVDSTSPKEASPTGASGSKPSSAKSKQRVNGSGNGSPRSPASTGKNKKSPQSPQGQKEN